MRRRRGGGGVRVGRRRGPAVGAAPRLGTAGGGLVEPVRRGIEVDPSIAGEIDLHPHVGVSGADHVVVVGEAVGAAGEAADQPDGQAQAAQHVPHRRGEVLAVALMRLEEEVGEGVGALRRRGGVEAVGVEIAVAQIGLDGTGLVVGVAQPLGDPEGEVVDAGQDRGRAVALGAPGAGIGGGGAGEVAVGVEPGRVVGAGLAQLVGGGDGEVGVELIAGPAGGLGLELVEGEDAVAGGPRPPPRLARGDQDRRPVDGGQLAGEGAAGPDPARPSGACGRRRSR